MACKEGPKLRKFVEVCVNDKLFDKELRTSVFKTFLEVLKNASNGNLSHCFGKGTKKRCKEHRSIIKTLLNGNKRIEKRKRNFLKAPKSFKNFVHNYLICDFMKNCVDAGEN